MTSSSDPALLADADLLRTIFESVAAGIAVCDQQGILVCFNSEAERILGMGARPVGPEDWPSLYGCYRPDGATLYLPEELPLARALAGEQVHPELMFIRSPGQPEGSWISVSAKQLVDRAGLARGAVALFRDVTAAERVLRNHLPTPPPAAAGSIPSLSVWATALEALDGYRGHYERLCRAVEQTADAILITNRQGLIEYTNPAFEAISGYTAREVLGRKPNILKSGYHDNRFYEAVWAKLLAGEPFLGTIVNRKKSGELFWAEQSISPIKNEVGCITHFVSVLKDITAERKQREQEFHLQLAREIQEHLYRNADTVPGFDVAAIASPADVTGGDYFDIISHPDGHVTVAIGDVSGHGVGSALVMAGARAYVRALTRSRVDTASLLRSLNTALASDLHQGMFMTLMLIQVDPQNCSFEYAGAGHLPGYLVGSDRKTDLVLGSAGPPLGLLPEATYTATGPIPYRDGDAIVLFTDGVTEARNAEGQEFMSERAVDFVKSRLWSGARELVEGLVAAVLLHCGQQGQSDDITTLVCKLK